MIEDLLTKNIEMNHPKMPFSTHTLPERMSHFFPFFDKQFSYAISCRN